MELSLGLPRLVPRSPSPVAGSLLRPWVVLQRRLRGATLSEAGGPRRHAAGREMQGPARGGALMLDNPNIEVLRQACIRCHRQQFLLVVAPLPIPGATGSAVNAYCRLFNLLAPEKVTSEVAPEQH